MSEQDVGKRGHRKSPLDTNPIVYPVHAIKGQTVVHIVAFRLMQHGRIDEPIKMMEDAYILKDPFSSEGGIIPLGSHCTICGKSVCLSQECSIFYTRRFCVHCVKENISEFPPEIQTEVMKKKNK